MNEREAHVIEREDQVVDVQVCSIDECVLEGDEVLILDCLEQLDIFLMIVLFVILLHFCEVFKDFVFIVLLLLLLVALWE